jgi:hypothetical protein
VNFSERYEFILSLVDGPSDACPVGYSNIVFPTCEEQQKAPAACAQGALEWSQKKAQPNLPSLVRPRPNKQSSRSDSSILHFEL